MVFLGDFPKICAIAEGDCLTWLCGILTVITLRYRVQQIVTDCFAVITYFGVVLMGVRTSKRWLGIVTE